MSIFTQPQPPFTVDIESERLTTWPDGTRVYCKDTNKSYVLDNGVFVLIGGSGGASSWGGITGTLSAQTDLNTAMGLKSDTSHTHALLHSNSLDHAAGSDNQDLSNLVTKVTGKELSTNDFTDTYKNNSHASGSDNQDLSGKVDKVTNYSLVLDTEITKIHSNTLDHSNANDHAQNASNSSCETSGAVATHSALKTGVHGLLNSIRVKTQVTPTAKTTAVTLTIAELLTGIITGNPTAAAAYTLPTGTLCEGGLTIGINESFDWVLINIATTATYIITLTAGTGHTIVGGGAIPANSATTGGLWGTNAQTFRTRKTATNTFITYRIG